jgi:CheY-like chemotaxis protein
LPSIAIRRSVIIRSTSRREATPARASSLAMRWPSRAAAGGRGGGSVFSVQQRESVNPANASNRSALRHQDPVQPLRAGKERAYMLFSKRERLIRRILVVEDEPLVAFDNEHLLSDAGYDVVGTVDNLSDAARLIDEEEIDLILTDVSLNGEGDGMDVARAAAAKKVPVLFVTAAPPPEAHGLGIGCLAKPYSDKGLKAALEALDDKLRGKATKRLPPGLSLYEGA